MYALGAQCEYDIHVCDKAPCVNNAVCTEQKGNDYSCNCQPGFTGQNCSVSYTYSNCN